MKNRILNNKGITLIEMMIVVAIIGILSAIAVPLYTGYIKQAKLDGAIAGATLWKTAVEQCILDTGGTTDCDGGVGLVPDDISTGDDGATIKYLDGVTTLNGTISVTTTVTEGTSKLTQTYTPSITNGYVTWTESGTGF